MNLFMHLSAKITHAGSLDHSFLLKYGLVEASNWHFVSLNVRQFFTAFIGLGVLNENLAAPCLFTLTHEKGT